MAKLVDEFRSFLAWVVDLNPARIARLEQTVGAIERFLKNTDFAPPLKRFSAQGSWVLGTIIKPARDNGEFDADIAVYFEEVQGWQPRDYVVELARLFRANGIYAGIVRKKTRCVTLDYTGDYHIDVVPIIVKPATFLFEDDQFFVCNSNDNCFEATDGDGYAEWWQKNNKRADGTLIPVVKLLKYLRDIKTTFSAKSILLTTLVGRTVDSSGILSVDDDYDDIPTAFLTVLSRLDDLLHEHDRMPEIKNPVLEGENFNRHWTEEKFVNFRDQIHRYRCWAEEAYIETDRVEAAKKWQRLFGDGFGKDLVAAKGVEVEGIFSHRAHQTGDLVSILKTRGRSFLRFIPAVVEWMKPAPAAMSRLNLAVVVNAWRATGKNGDNIETIVSGSPVTPEIWIHFEASDAEGKKYDPDEFRVDWQIVNTGEAADDADCLRGGFEGSVNWHERYEKTEYHGAHWVQAYLYNKNTDQYDGVSDRFFVVVD